MDPAGAVASRQPVGTHRDALLKLSIDIPSIHSAPSMSRLEHLFPDDRCKTRRKPTWHRNGHAPTFWLLCFFFSTSSVPLRALDDRERERERKNSNHFSFSALPPPTARFIEPRGTGPCVY